jgi:hypothetical protein
VASYVVKGGGGCCLSSYIEVGQLRCGLRTYSLNRASESRALPKSKALILAVLSTIDTKFMNHSIIFHNTRNMEFLTLKTGTVLPSKRQSVNIQYQLIEMHRNFALNSNRFERRYNHEYSSVIKCCLSEFKCWPSARKLQVV